MKAELQGLQLGTKAIQKELLGILEKSKNDFLAGKEEMKRELQKMRVEAKPNDSRDKTSSSGSKGNLATGNHGT